MWTEKIQIFYRAEKRYTWKRAQNRYPGMEIMTTKTTTIRTLYVHVHVVLNGVIFPQTLYGIVPYARHFLPVKFFPKYCFNKLCIQLPQNVAWTDKERAWLARVQANKWSKIGPSHLLIWRHENVKMKTRWKRKLICQMIKEKKRNLKPKWLAQGIT